MTYIITGQSKIIMVSGKKLSNSSQIKNYLFIKGVVEKFDYEFIYLCSSHNV